MNNKEKKNFFRLHRQSNKHKFADAIDIDRGDHLYRTHNTWCSRLV